MPRIPSPARVRLLALALLLPMASAALAQKIEQQMTYEQFKAAGLDQLTPEQLGHLNAWLEGRLKVETAKAAEVAKAEVREETQQDRRGLFSSESREPVTSQLSGSFNGFGKGRQFTLDNGQVWKQIDGI